jgi:hypothetical protein
MRLLLNPLWAGTHTSPQKPKSKRAMCNPPAPIPTSRVMQGTAPAARPPSAPPLPRNSNLAAIDSLLAHVIDPVIPALPALSTELPPSANDPRLHLMLSLAPASPVCPSATFPLLSTSVPLFPANAVSTSFAPISLFQSLNALVNMSSHSPARPGHHASLPTHHDVGNPPVPEAISDATSAASSPVVQSAASPIVVSLSTHILNSLNSQGLLARAPNTDLIGLSLSLLHFLATHMSCYRYTYIHAAPLLFYISVACPLTLGFACS